MEPLSEQELNDLLLRWQAPGAPASLKAKVLARPRPWWKWLATGSIRIPVPVGVALLLLAALLYFRPYEKPAVVQPAKSVSLADFQPVKQLEPRIVGRANESN